MAIRPGMWDQLDAKRITASPPTLRWRLHRQRQPPPRQNPLQHWQLRPQPGQRPEEEQEG
jgi:hypothetical protein